MNSQAISAKLTANRAAFGEWLAASKTDEGYNLDAQGIEEFHRRNDAIATLQKEYEDALLVESKAAENEAKLASAGRLVAAENPDQKDAKPQSITTKAAWQSAFKSAIDANRATFERIAKGGRGTVSFDLDVEHKTLLTLADIAPQADRQAIAPSAQYLGQIEDLFLPGETDSKSVDYYVETTFTNNAAAVAEGNAATDSALDFTLSTDPVETIQAWLPVTREALADVPALRSYVEGRLAHQLAIRVSAQLAAGDGTSPNISGITDRAGIQTQAKGADPTFDAIHKAITKVRVTGDAEPTAICIHPTDWEEIRLTRTADGLYILGNPSEGGVPPLFGVPVRLTTSFGAAGTGVVGSFRPWAQVFNRAGLTVEVSTEHSTYFTERKVAVALMRRLALAVYRESAFCTVTGI
jgi:HK97 family phage major capsid protein